MFALQEAVQSLATPSQLRRLFIDLLINECANFPTQLWETFRNELCFDYSIANPFNKIVSTDYALADIELMLIEYGKNLSDYGLQRDLLKYNLN